jgi:hypothetical protein
MKLCLSVIAAILFGSASAHAQPAIHPDKLFSEGFALMGEEKYTEALLKLEEAQALDPGIGTQFNIAICYEKLGKLGTAWRNYTTVQQLAHASGKTGREDSSRLKLEELRPRLSVLVITLEGTEEAVVRVDGVAVPRSEWASYPVDPGPHRVDAEATARRPWTNTVDAPPPGGRLEIRVQTLVSSVVTVTTETTNSRRTLGIVLGGVGIAGLVTATVTGIIILGDRSTAEKACTPKCANPDGTPNQPAIDDVNQGKTLVPINLVAWGVAVAGIGAGTYLMLTSTKKVTPMVGAQATGLLFSGTL